MTSFNYIFTADVANRPVSHKLKYLWNVNDHQLTVVAYIWLPSGDTETYGTWNNYRHGCSNCTEFLNYKNRTMKYDS